MHRLQWGRSLSTAETGDAPVCVCDEPVLQWGRSLSTAETIRENALGRPNLRCQASMGPQSFNCGNRVVDEPPSLSDSSRQALQWGRSLSTAETQWRMAVKRRTAGGFNGAAVFQLRKRAWPAIAAAVHASMGPQSFNCGNRTYTGSSRRRARLQWGRSLSTAETGSRRRPCRHVWLQWGRSLSTAETGCGRTSASRWLASMGPQSFNCGNGEPADCPAINDASMGPQSFNCGNGRPSEASPT